MIIPNKTVKIYPGNNSWVSKSLKKTLNKKKIAFSLKTRLNGNLFKVNSERKSEKQGNGTKKEFVCLFHTGNVQDARKGLKTLAWQTKPKFNKLDDKQKERSDELNDFYCWFDSQVFRTELAQIRSELQEKMVDDVDFETEAKIVEGIFLKLNQESNWSWQHMWKTFEIVCFPAFCCFQSVVHVVSERKHCTLHLENLLFQKNKTKNKQTESFLFKQLSSNCFDIYCNEVFWLYYPPPTHETHKAPFRPIPVCVQAQQKHRRCYIHSFAQCIYSSWKNRFICLNSLHQFFFCLQHHTTTPHGKQTFEIRR